MSFIDDLRRRATGIFPTSGNAGDAAGETAMDVNYDSNQTFTSPFFGKKGRNPYSGLQEFQPVPYRINEQGKKVAADGSDATMQGAKPGMSTMDMKQNEYTQEGMKALGLGESQFQKIFGISYKDAGERWKNKGGFEGLMSNPAFTLGLGIMKSSAMGQPISQSLLNNAVAAGAISGEYSERIKARSELTGPITDEQRDEVRSVLAESDIFEGSVGQKFKNFFSGKNTEALNRRALDDIYKEAEKIAKKRSKSRGGQKARIEREDIEKATRALKSSGKLDISDKGLMSFFFGRGIQSKKPGLAKGGPAKEGKEYIVGEEGPEMFVPQVDGNVIDNDDTKVVNMLLESNPQLKNISRARAVKILKNRFPDYF
jgi:hypothetical protein